MNIYLFMFTVEVYLKVNSANAYVEVFLTENSKEGNPSEYIPAGNSNP